MTLIDCVPLFGIVAFACFCSAQRPSPCPQVFEYVKNDEPGKLSGSIHLTTSEELQGVWLHISLDSPAQLLLNWFGESTSSNNKDFTIRNTRFKLEPGITVTVKIQILYDATNITPKVTKIRLNGRSICSEDGVTSTTRLPTPFISQPKDQVTEISTKSTTAPTSPTQWTRPTSRFTTSRTTTTTAEEEDDDQSGSDTFFKGDQQYLLNNPNTAQILHKVDTLECGTVTTKGTPLIKGGQRSKEGDWPWHIALYTTAYICGGSLINRDHILTAAHCVTKPGTNRRSNYQGFLVHLGRTNRKKYTANTQLRRLSKIIVHPQYNYSYFHNDIALLKLEQPVDYTDYVRPICLWDQGQQYNAVGKLGTVVGWGYDEKNHITDDLHEAKMPIIDVRDCLYSNPNFYSRYTSRSSFCAGFRNGTSVCNGDSGGGLYLPKDGTEGENTRWELKGLVSVSLPLQNKVCDPFSYIVFTDVAHFTDWVKGVLEN